MMKMLMHLALVVMLVGCASTLSSPVKQASQQYGSVSRSMTRDEVYRMLGQPQSVDADGREHWRVADKKQVAELWLRFSPDGKVAEIEKRYPLK